MKTWLQRGLVASGVVLCIGFAGCSSDEFTAASGGGSGDGGPDSASGGTGGTTDGGGSGGLAGGGTGGTVQTCSSPADCDNGKACDGEEDCVSGKCVAGTSPCNNPDAAHCATTCDESGGSAQCGVAAKDADGDGHGDLECTQAPGDDCDDTNKDVYPGQTEVCDGVDGNCNGKADIDDGFSLAGTDQDLIISSADALQPAIAWSPHASLYGVTWQDLRDATADDPEIYFAMMDQTGTKKSTELRVSNAAGNSANTQVAWGHNSFGIVWADNRAIGEGAGIYFRRVGEDGKFLSGEVNLTKSLTSGTAVIADFPTIVATTAGWAVFFQADGGTEVHVLGLVIDPDGSVTVPVKTFSTPGTLAAFPRAAVGSGDIGIVLGTNPSLALPDTVRLQRTDATLADNGQNPISTSGAQFGAIQYFAQLAPVGGGWAAAWRSTSSATGSVTFVNVDGSGTATCGPKNTTTFSDDAAPAGVVLAGDERLVPVSEGAYIAGNASTVGTSKVRLGRFDAGCNELSTLEIAAGQTIDIVSVSSTAIAAGDAGFAVVWQSLSGTHRRIRVRTFGPHLCD